MALTNKNMCTYSPVSHKLPCCALLEIYAFIRSNAVLKPGRGCSILTTSLVNVSLKFQMLTSEICQYFLLKNVKSFCNAKAFLIFSTKNISVFGYEVIKHLTS